MTNNNKRYGMTNNKNFLRKSGRLLCLIAAAVAAVAFLTCEPVPDYCGRFVKYDPKFQFCFDGKSHSLCGGNEYNPLTQGCTDKNEVGTKCADSTFVMLGTPCGGFTITTGSAPAYGGWVTVFPDLPNYDAGENVTLTAQTEYGYVFDGWAGAETSKNAAVTVTMDANKPIIAMFRPLSEPGATEHTLAVTAFPEHGGTVSPDGASNYSTGTPVTVTATPYDGYDFSGWSGASTSKSATTTVTMNAGQTLVAIFTPTVYSLTVNANPRNGGTVFIDGTALVGHAPQNAGTEVTAMAVPAEGYSFVRWSGASTSTDPSITVNITSTNQTLTANFEEKPFVPPSVYALTVNAGTGGTVSPSGTSNHYSNEMVTIRATASSGYVFRYWTVTSGNAVFESVTSATTMVRLNSDATIRANFQLQDTDTPAGTYRLTTVAIPDAGGSITRTPESSPMQEDGVYSTGREVSVEAHPEVGYMFSHWEGAATGTTNPVKFNMDSELTIIAHFQNVSGLAGEVIDSRDNNRRYRTTTIGDRIWMAENLNYQTSDSWCYEEDYYYCQLYGRLYSFDAAVSACQGLGDGWRLPDTSDWRALINAAGGNVAGERLKSTTGWDTHGYTNGIDALGFSGLPGGQRVGGNFGNVNESSFWWSFIVYEDEISTCGYRYRLPGWSGVELNWCYSIESNEDGFSVRCIKDR